MVYKETKNNMSRRSITRISLRESNEYGGNLIMYLYTVEEIHSNEWMELLINDGVVKRLE